MKAVLYDGISSYSRSLFQALTVKSHVIHFHPRHVLLPPGLQLRHVRHRPPPRAGRRRRRRQVPAAQVREDLPADKVEGVGGLGHEVDPPAGEELAGAAAEPEDARGV